jgi:hypothetical protein
MDPEDESFLFNVGCGVVLLAVVVWIVIAVACRC